MTAPNITLRNGFTVIFTPVVCILVLLASSSKQVAASPKTHVEHYPNGSIHFKVEVDEAQKPHGWSREYTDSGILKAEHHYVHGIRDGISRLYYTTGELMTEWNYRSGKRHGPSFGYFKNGRLKDKGTYRNDLLEGTVYKYYTDGGVKARMRFKRGRLEGESFIYDQNGKVQHIYHYFKGQAWTREDYSPDGELLRKQEFPQPSVQP